MSIVAYQERYPEFRWAFEGNTCGIKVYTFIFKKDKLFTGEVRAMDGLFAGRVILSYRGEEVGTLLKLTDPVRDVGDAILGFDTPLRERMGSKVKKLIERIYEMKINQI
jgi:hypothetical protein